MSAKQNIGQNRKQGLKRPINKKAGQCGPRGCPDKFSRWSVFYAKYFYIFELNVAYKFTIVQFSRLSGHNIS